MEGQMKQLEDQGFLLLSTDLDVNYHGPKNELRLPVAMPLPSPRGPKWTDAAAPAKLIRPEEEVECLAVLTKRSGGAYEFHCM